MESTNVPISSEVESVKIKIERLDVDEESPNTKDETTINDEKSLEIDIPINKLKIKIEPTEDGLTELSVESPELDNTGEEVIMSPEEVRNYLDNKIKEYFLDSEANKLMKLYKRSLELREILKYKNDEYVKIQKVIELIFRNQEKFLRQAGILPKIPTYNRGITVDLPLHQPLESLKTTKLFDSNSAQQTDKVSQPPPNKNGTPSNPSSRSSSVSSSSTTKESIECIDLTDDSDCSDKSKTSSQCSQPNRLVTHPAPFPPRPFIAQDDSLLKVPPRPRLRVNGDNQGIVLQWDMPPIFNPDKFHAKIIAYEIFGYQVLPKEVICTLLWKKIGTVKAMTLPMACTLTQFLEGHKYFFAIRAVDMHNRPSNFSEALSIIYTSRKKDNASK